MTPTESEVERAMTYADVCAKCDLVSVEMEMFMALAAEVRRLHARVRELEEALAATRMDIRWHTCEESSECLACDEDALIEKPHHED